MNRFFAALTVRASGAAPVRSLDASAYGRRRDADPAGAIDDPSIGDSSAVEADAGGPYPEPATPRRRPGPAQPGAGPTAPAAVEAATVEARAHPTIGDRESGLGGEDRPGSLGLEMPADGGDARNGASGAHASAIGSHAAPMVRSEHEPWPIASRTGPEAPRLSVRPSTVPEPPRVDDVASAGETGAVHDGRGRPAPASPGPDRVSPPRSGPPRSGRPVEASPRRQSQPPVAVGVAEENGPALASTVRLEADRDGMREPVSTAAAPHGPTDTAGPGVPDSAIAGGRMLSLSAPVWSGPDGGVAEPGTTPPVITHERPPLSRATRVIDAGGKSGAGAAESIAPHLAEVGAPGLVAAPAHTAPVRASAAPRLKSGATPAFDQPMHRDPERRQPVVNVTIGRIDIREGPDSRPPLATKKPRAPALGLGAYLDRRFRRAPR